MFKYVTGSFNLNHLWFKSKDNMSELYWYFKIKVQILCELYDLARVLCRYILLLLLLLLGLLLLLLPINTTVCFLSI